MAITTLGVTISVGLRWNAQKSIVGSDYTPLTQVGQINKALSLSTAITNANAGGADQFVSFLTSVTANAGSTTINCLNLTNILQQTSQGFSRIKGYVVRLLSLADDAVYGTNCSGVQIGCAAANTFLFNMLGATNTFNVGKGGVQGYFDSLAGGLPCGATCCNITIRNPDVTNVANCQITLVGGGA